MFDVVKRGVVRFAIEIQAHATVIGDSVAVVVDFVRTLFGAGWCCRAFEIVTVPVAGGETIVVRVRLVQRGICVVTVAVAGGLTVAVAIGLVQRGVNIVTVVTIVASCRDRSVPV